MGLTHIVAAAAQRSDIGSMLQEALSASQMVTGSFLGELEEPQGLLSFLSPSERASLEGTCLCSQNQSNWTCQSIVLAAFLGEPSDWVVKWVRGSSRALRSWTLSSVRRGWLLRQST